jgi:hypothetical protein
LSFFQIAVRQYIYIVVGAKAHLTRLLHFYVTTCTASRPASFVSPPICPCLWVIIKLLSDFWIVLLYQNSRLDRLVLGREDDIFCAFTIIVLIWFWMQ